MLINRYGICIDINECSDDLEICNVTSETCINLPGRYKCICRWGFMWSMGQGICVPDMAVERAEIRLVTGDIIIGGLSYRREELTLSMIYYF